MAVYLVAAPDLSAWVGLAFALGVVGLLGWVSQTRHRVALLVVTLVLLSGMAWAGQPTNGCQQCLANGNSWWWCFSIYGPLCYL